MEFELTPKGKRAIERRVEATAPDKIERIRALNDFLRYNGSTAGNAAGRFCISRGVDALPLLVKAGAIAAMATFNKFTPENDPHGEHDFGSFECVGRNFIWKIDYYDKAMTCGSEDPSDPEKTTRVLVLMLAEEY